MYKGGEKKKNAVVKKSVRGFVDSFLGFISDFAVLLCFFFFFLLYTLCKIEIMKGKNEVKLLCVFVVRSERREKMRKCDGCPF